MTALMLMYNEGSYQYLKELEVSHVYDDFGFEPVDDQIEASKHGMKFLMNTLYKGSRCNFVLIPLSCYLR